MTTTLILYASKHGHTAKVAERIGDALRDRGACVDRLAIAAGDVPDLKEYDTVVVGASVHAGHHQREVTDWLTDHAVTLNAMPSAFFSVSLTAAEDGDEARDATRKYVDDVLAETGWSPTLETSIAGALQYREYDFFTKTLMRLLMAHRHQPTDVTQDYDYTDWDAVDAFAQQIADLASVPAATEVASAHG